MWRQQQRRIGKPVAPAIVFRRICADRYGYAGESCRSVCGGTRRLRLFRHAQSFLHIWRSSAAGAKPDRADGRRCDESRRRIARLDGTAIPGSPRDPAAGSGATFPGRDGDRYRQRCHSFILFSGNRGDLSRCTISLADARRTGDDQ